MSDSLLYGWDRCSHEGIGMPGCGICDPVCSRRIARAVWVEREECAAGAEFCANNAATFAFVATERGHLTAEQVAAAAFRAAAQAIRARGGNTTITTLPVDHHEGRRRKR